MFETVVDELICGEQEYIATLTLGNEPEQHWYSDPTGVAATAAALGTDNPEQYDIAEQIRRALMHHLVGRIMTIVDFAFARANASMRQEPFAV